MRSAGAVGGRRLWRRCGRKTVVEALWTEDGCGGTVAGRRLWRRCGVWVRDVVGGNECEAEKQGGGCEV